jgi:hypothetical protein
VKQKENIFEELSKMRNLIHTKPGTVISEQSVVGAPNYGMTSPYTPPGTPKLASTNTPSGYDLSGTKTSDERQKNINGNYCSVKNGVIVTGGASNGMKWDDYVKTYSLTTDELAKAKASCGNKSGGGNNRANDYARMVGDYSKKVQTELGSSATGQISDADLQKALSLLDGEVSGEVGQLDKDLPKTEDGQIDLVKALELLDK